MAALAEGDIQHPLHSNATTGEGARHGYSMRKMHTCIISFIAIFGVCLQLKYPNVSPYETPYGSVMMNLLVTEICFYIASLILMAIQAASDNRDMEHLTNKIGLFLGTLSLILEVLILVSPLGWILMSVWNICLVYFLCKSYRSVHALYGFLAAKIGQDFDEVKQKLVALKRRVMDGNNEAANGGGIELPTQKLNIGNGNNGDEHVISMHQDS